MHAEAYMQADTHAHIKDPSESNGHRLFAIIQNENVEKKTHLQKR